MRIFIALALVTGCSDDADIGVGGSPITCAPDAVATATVSGSVRDPGNGNEFGFAFARPSVTSPMTPALQLAGGDSPTTGANVILRFGFYCGAAQVQTYGVVPDDQTRLQCPDEVAGEVVGQIEYLPAQSGVMIVDEAVNCLAGRFNVDFGANGAVHGSFSTPWQ